MDLKDYIGLPYKSHGRSLDGLDCFGILQLFYKDQFGIDVDGAGFTYARADISEQVERDVRHEESKEFWTIVEGDPKFADIVLFRVRGFVSHVGIVLEDNNFLHSFPGRDSVIESLDAISWKKRIAGYRRHVLLINND